MDKNAVSWNLISNPPEKSGYILLAIRHNNLPDVVMGHYSKLRGFSCKEYPQGVNTHFEYWAYRPKHPDGETWKE